MRGDEGLEAGVTVLLPVYNGGRFLRCAIESLLAQTHTGFELLVIDDGSTDGSAHVLDRVTDERVRVIHQANQGLVGALNTGLAATRTELVARMDQDDLSAPNRLEVQLAYLRAHPGVAAVGCCYEVMDEDDVTTTTAHVAAQPGYLRRQLYFRNVLPHGAMLYRRSAVIAVGGYREVGPAEDYDLWARLAMRYDVASIPDVLFRYRVTATGMSVQSAAEQRRSVHSIRDDLHRRAPLSLTVAQVFADGSQHHQAFLHCCFRPLRGYLYDHVWLVVLLARRGRWRAASAAALGVLALVLRHPLATLSPSGATQRRSRNLQA